MADRDPVQTLHSVVHTYLATLMAVADCLGEACPPVGAPHRHRLGRLRTRLSFNASKEAIEQSAVTVRSELKDFAAKASLYFSSNTAELRRASKGLEEIARTLAQRQSFYATRLRQFAAQMETTPYPTDPEHLREVVALQSAGLMSCVESMSHEAQSLLGRARNLLADVEQRLAEAEITDPVTGLMNRREMERRIASRLQAGEAVTPMLFRAGFEATPEHRDELVQQIAARLSAQIRYNDLLCRWSEREFVVLFHCAADIAQKRSAQVVQGIAGRYTLESGQVYEVNAAVQTVEPAPATAAAE